ncbi:transketolase C-terminal domain-containing protein [Streptomyces sp. NRRL S-244]|uniref:transketolase C-terminal domain-containing protein n=1 Tax=Streptomyces sp. NRRL S-244 TaxID=1463897 RepID=UPI0004C1034E|nr:transketolase C-terminal domain-containing protein [Streptomyces sp. NRRL S-244]
MSALSATDESQLEAFTHALCDELLRGPDPFVIITCDATLSFRLGDFARRHPHLVVDVGVAEATAVAAAFGMWRAGFKVVVAGFAAFLSLRALEPIRSLVALHGADVTFLAGMTGLSAGRDGAQHHATEDAALLRAVPGIEVVAPSDTDSARALAAYCAGRPGPRWVRLVRRPVPLGETPDAARPWSPVRRLTPQVGQVLLCAHGALCEQAQQAARILIERHGIAAAALEVGRLSPTPRELSAALAGFPLVLACEDQYRPGALASALDEALAEADGPRSRVVRCDLTASPGSGDYADLLFAAGLTAEQLASRAVRAICETKDTAVRETPEPLRISGGDE